MHEMLTAHILPVIYGTRFITTSTLPCQIISDKVKWFILIFQIQCNAFLKYSTTKIYLTQLPVVSLIAMKLLLLGWLTCLRTDNHLDI